MIHFSRYKDISFFSPDEVRATQQKLLRRHLAYCRERSPFYQNLFKKHRIHSSKITLDNLCELPFTDKADIEENNDEFLAVGPDKLSDIVLSSGTAGKPTKISYTESDLKRLAYNEEKSFRACGFTRKDVVLLTCTLDRCFIAGLAYFQGVRALGATAIRNGLNSVESHIQIIRQMKPTAVVGVPGFLRKLGHALAEGSSITRKRTVSKLVCIGEPLRGEKLEFLKIASDLEDMWGAKAYSTYSSSEIVTTFCECEAQAGGHLHPDLAVVEIVDEEGRILAPGEKGEVVVTPLSVEGMPLVRFKTGDISFIVDRPCACGRNTVRLGPILGRKKQMLKVRGTTIYPQTLYSVLEEIKGVGEYYVVLTSEGELSDAIAVHLSVDTPDCTAEAVQEKLQARLRVKPQVIIEDDVSVRGQIYTLTSRKPIRLIDRRQ